MDDDRADRRRQPETASRRKAPGLATGKGPAQPKGDAGSKPGTKASDG